MPREMRCLVRVFLKQSLPHNLERGRKENGEKGRKEVSASFASLCMGLNNLAKAMGRV